MTAKKVLKGSTKRKIKVFAILLTCSFMAWLISQLSETYTDQVTFKLNYVRVPDTLLLMGASQDDVSLAVRGSGWQFLGSRFSSGTLNINLSKVTYNRGRFFLGEQNYREQLSSALPDAMSVVRWNTDTLFFEFSRLVSKKVPVIPEIELNLAQDYLLERDLEIMPDSVLITGPEKELDTLMAVRTEAVELNEVSESFSRTLRLIRPASLTQTRYNAAEVVVKAEVFRFSEKILEIPVEVINLPEGTQIRTFPNTVEVLCKARLETLKSITSSEFRAEADLGEAQDASPFLPVRLVQQPENVPSIQLLQRQVEYILKRE
ncbi:YbbR-like protein [Muriicola jejuensis]|uniref:YbbR-like domain-containing protein n=1 Tax=Muriicola jejuensis TaxID=504488 RepID=A0A6P0UF34_9FLAO|nr:CdaR family protein [Muriicola jejuensis]NER11070.1 hypothetical protein [Muriicola jejuensis]SMP23284.1 YbbR-like protein [Muriicola jejuensis]